MSTIPLETEIPQRLDLLNRQDFIDKLQEIVDILAKNKKNMCYSINGRWGVGKSYVLDMFEEQAQRIGQEGTVLDKYIIFRYNCWEYDYYEEPLIAIVASIIEQYEQKISLLGEADKAAIDEIIKRTFIKVGKKLLTIGAARFKGVTGIDIDPEKMGDFIKDVLDDTHDKLDENHEFDKLFDFKAVLKELRDNLTALTQHHTVIIIVDELDRCLPEYTIRVLERLHHLFDNIPNVQVIISIDRMQLEHVVKQIYGKDTDAKKYLEKFIAFELNLPIGSLNEEADSFFDFYYSQFEDTTGFVDASDFEEFKKIILEGIDTRSRLAIMERCNLLHSIMSKDDAKADILFACIEIFLTILKFYDIDVKFTSDNFNIPTLFDASKTCRQIDGKRPTYTLPGLATMRKKLENPYPEIDPSDSIYMVELRSERSIDGQGAHHPLLRGVVRRNRKGASGRLQLAFTNSRRRAFDG